MKKLWLLLGIPVLWVCVAAASADDWPQLRGPNRDDVSKEKGLLQAWPKGGPKLLWKQEDAGVGFAGFSIVGNVLYTMGGRNEEEYAIALDVNNQGKQLWATKLGPIFLDPVKQFGDGPRATPTVDGDHVYCLSGQGELVCLKRQGGEVVWRKSMVKDFKGELMELVEGRNWGYCESPLIHDNKLICCPGGPDGWMIALDKMTGQQLWRTAKVQEAATDASIMLAELGGVKQYLNLSYKGSSAALLGVSAANGDVLWYAPLKDWECYNICSTPIVLGDLVYVSSTKGCSLFKIEKDAAGKFEAKELYNSKAKRVMQNDHGGVLLVDGNVFGYSDASGWVCQELKEGKEIWKEKRELEGKGSLTYADGHLYLFSDKGEAVLLKANTQKTDFWQEKGRFSLPSLSKINETRPGNSSAGVWTHPVVANGRLYLRDQELIYCYEVK